MLSILDRGKCLLQIAAGGGASTLVFVGTCGAVGGLPERGSQVNRRHDGLILVVANGVNGVGGKTGHGVYASRNDVGSVMGIRCNVEQPTPNSHSRVVSVTQRHIAFFLPLRNGSRYEPNDTKNYRITFMNIEENSER